MPELKSEGWTWLWNARKFHYFRDGQSLCGRWMLLVKESEDFNPSDDFGSPDNCKACEKKRLKEVEGK